MFWLGQMSKSRFIQPARSSEVSVKIRLGVAGVLDTHQNLKTRVGTDVCPAALGEGRIEYA